MCLLSCGIFKHALPSAKFLCPFLQETASRLTPETLKGVMAEIKSGFYSVDDLTVQLPRFKIEQTHELRQTLEALGLETLFDPTSSQLGRFIDSSAEGGGHDVPLNRDIKCCHEIQVNFTLI